MNIRLKMNRSRKPKTFRHDHLTLQFRRAAINGLSYSRRIGIDINIEQTVLRAEVSDAESAERALTDSKN